MSLQEEAEIKEVKIKHRGACPEYLGHCCESCAFVVGVFFATLVCLLTFHYIIGPK